MVDQIRVVTFTSPASGDPALFDVTHPELTEPWSAALLIYSGFTVDDNDNIHAINGIGFLANDAGTTTMEEAVVAHAQNGQNTTPNCGTRNSNAACISVGDPTVNNAATAQCVASFDSAIAGSPGGAGVRLNFSTRTIQLKFTVILFHGLSRAYTDECSGATGGTHENVGGTTKFQPDLVIFAASSQAVNVNLPDASPNIGFALNKTGLPQVCAYVDADDATEPTDADGFVRSANAYGHFVNAGSRAGEFSTVTSFDSTGFNHTSSAGTPDAHYLALKFSGAFRMACANLAVAAATGLQAFNDFGFTPDVVLGMSTLLASLDTTTDGATASTSGYFVTGRYGSRAYTWHHEEGITLAGAVVANAHSRQGEAAVLQYNHTGTVVQKASWVGGSGSGGFVLDFSTASAGGFLTALGIQFVPSPPRGRRPRRPEEKPQRRRRRLKRLSTAAKATPIRRHPAPAKKQPQRQRRRRRISAGVKRAARYGRMLRAVRQNREGARRRRRARALGAPTFVRLVTDPVLVRGDNAMAGSLKGANAGAGAVLGDSG